MGTLWRVDRVLVWAGGGDNFVGHRDPMPITDSVQIWGASS